MRLDILTLFPGIFSSFLAESILARAIKKGLLEIGLIDIRSFAPGPHRVTDDRPYGGGSGMVMKAEPVCRALESVVRVSEKSLVILLTPQGQTFNQSVAWKLAQLDQLILICGRYEGVDERIREGWVDLELSIGDYVLSGGELGAMVIVDAVSRLIPGVLGGEGSNLEDSFQDGLLEYPQYTRPRVFEGMEVPSVLLSGDHEKIRRWRRTQSLKRTLERRPDLVEKAELSDEDKAILAELKARE
ncbi:MAG: tRNA (guanosine(37)-N1)-methyltransferase TrmD [Deltaproteobacteria bacterium]|nr:tRNA (guanosine(37)-N1)-methyltransferase TrmD [Deltaproteobacteria bacterium]MBW1921156.1 tRNA (guanosine(37)-N1)-methyltransferase TrmD [Deltaproteobacteria bacterium]MBW1935412.1 tRNA (guanosine(37)-N1)-methyltransferase TrmD [Deltaproteobacteria bacterium]MBW1978649.1 tRNA (guanosine(37)-N1)-methyltransferase TrmD [Deltaproteobacteria bacterium]MBW2045091.1 tRNA (guanosine(37)-N1)-methyltransferase TrmD [Deltaproteobacteria bacterium]